MGRRNHSVTDDVAGMELQTPSDCKQALDATRSRQLQTPRDTAHLKFRKSYSRAVLPPAATLGRWMVPSGTGPIVEGDAAIATRQRRQFSSVQPLAASIGCDDWSVNWYSARHEGFEALDRVWWQRRIRSRVSHGDAYARDVGPVGPVHHWLQR